MAKQILEKVTKEKIPNKVVAIILVVILLFLNMASLEFYLIAERRAQAAYEASELESQKTSTKSKNVEFDAYYLSSTGERKHSTSNKFGETDELYIELNIKDDGYLKDAKIEILDTNFSLTENLDEVDTIQNMDSETKEIDLKIIHAGPSIVYNFPIQSEKSEHFNLNDFNKNNKVKLTGTYVDNNAKEIKIEKEIILNTEWYGDIEAVLDQEIVRYVPYTTAESKGILVQLLVRVDITEQENSLPIKNTVISTVAPELQVFGLEDENGIKEVMAFKPIDSKVTSNGTSLTNARTIDNLEFNQDNYEYNKETGVLKISVENNPDENENVWSGYKGLDEYLVSYIYAAEAYDNLSEDIVLDSVLTAEIYAYNTPNQEEQTVSLAESTKQFILQDKIGEIIEYKVGSSYNSINKGYMYTNFENDNANETVYSVDWIANIGYINEEGLVMKSTVPVTSNAQNLYDNNSYRSTQISKSTFEQILGEDGVIEIFSEENIIGKIDKNTDPDENGMLKVDYSDTNDITIRTSSPISTGMLKITNAKTVGGSFTLTEAKNFKNIINTLNYKEALIELEEPSTNVILEINKNRISATNVNENVEIKVTLQKNGVQYNLFKNPKVYLEFPSFVEDIEINDLSQPIYADGLEIENIKITNNDAGNLVAVISLAGNQTIYSTDNIIGTQIILNTNIIVKELTPTVNAEIKAYIYNEKSTGYKEVDENISTVDGLAVGYVARTLDFIAPTGVITKTTVSNFNRDNNTITTDELNRKPAMGKINVYSNRKTATMESTVLNNYGKDCEDVRILGRIPAQGSKSVISGEELNSTFDTTLKRAISLSGADENNIRIYYSENIDATQDLDDPQNGWSIDATNMSKSYLITLENYTLKQGEILTFSYDFEIPENLDRGESAFGTYAVLFNNGEEDSDLYEYIEALNVGLTTGEEANILIQTESTAENSIVHVGDRITYSTKIINEGLTNITNLTVTVPIPEGTTLVKHELISNAEGRSMVGI